MRVMHFQKVRGIGGSERHLLELLPALVRRGFELRMLVLGVGEYERFVQPLREKCVDVVVLRGIADIDPTLVFRIAREIRRFNPNILHTHLIHGDLYGQAAARLTGVPAISSVHGTLSIYRKQPYLSAARLAGHLARQTIAISEHARRFVEELALTAPDTICVVHYGIDASEWELSAQEREKTRADLGLEPKDVALGVASRLVAYKGHDFLIDAVTEALPEAPRLRLLVAGDGPLRRKLEHYARERIPQEVVHFLGQLSDIRRFMNACEIVAFPSLPGFGEGFGLAALEAMAAGKPVVASAVDSLPEIVTDQITGFLIPPGNKRLMAESLVRLANDAELAKTMGSSGRDRAIKVFPLESMVDKIAEVYRETQKRF